MVTFCAPESTSVSGGFLASVADRMPESAPRRSSRSRKNARPLISSYPLGVTSILVEATPVPSNPASAFRDASRLRATRPAVTSSSSETATCEVTRTMRKRPRAPVRGEKSSFITDRRSTPELRTAGNNPKTNALTQAAATEKAMTMRSTDRLKNTGMGARSLTAPSMKRMSSGTNASATSAAGAASTTFSTSSRRRIRARLAPRARRSAISPRRERPRASTRAVMLAQTISSSNAPIALSTMTAGSM